MLQAAKEKYYFRTYTDYSENENFILWRHDIDHSVHNALELAKIESKEGICATYFIHLHNEFYNFLEKDIFALIKNIQKLGHEIGLHFDIHFFNINNKDELKSALESEKEIINRLFDVDIKVFFFITPMTLQTHVLKKNTPV